MADVAQPEGAIPPQEVAKYRDGQRSLYEKWIMALLSQIGRARDAGSRAPLDEQDIAKISEFFRKRPPGEEPFSLLQANRLCALPPWLTAEAARAELAELCANSDTGSWHGLKPASFLSPLISPGNNTPKLALLAAAELPGAGPADPEKTPGALVSVANAAVLNMPTRVHAHFVAGEEPLETLAAAAKAKGGDIATIVVGLPLPGFPLPLAAPGKPARYTPSAFNVTVVYQLVALYLRHGDAELSITVDRHTGPLLEYYVPILNARAKEQGYPEIRLLTPISDEPTPSTPAAPTPRTAIPPPGAGHTPGAPGNGPLTGGPSMLSCLGGPV